MAFPEVLLNIIVIEDTTTGVQTREVSERACEPGACISYYLPPKCDKVTSFTACDPSPERKPHHIVLAD